MNGQYPVHPGYINYSYQSANQVTEASNPRGLINNAPRPGAPVGSPAAMSPYLNGNSQNPGFHDQGFSSATWGQTPGFAAFAGEGMLPYGYGANPGVTEEITKAVSISDWSDREKVQPSRAGTVAPPRTFAPPGSVAPPWMQSAPVTQVRTVPAPALPSWVLYAGIGTILVGGGVGLLFFLNSKKRK